MKLFIYALLMVLLLPVFLLGFPFYMVPILLSRGKVSGTAYEPFTFGLPVTPDFSGQLANYLAEHGLVLDCDRPLGDEKGGKVPYGGLVLAVTPTLP